MRLKLLALVTLVVATVVGCKPPPKEETVKAFQKELHLYFNNLNKEAHSQKDGLRRDIQSAQKNPALGQPTGMILNTFTFDENAFVVENYRCKTPACGVRLLLAAPSFEYLCRACGHSPYATHPNGHAYKESPCKVCVGGEGKPREPGADQISRDAFKLQLGAVVKEMFELTEDNPEHPMKAKVRYLRRQWVFDARGTVALPERVRTTVEAGWIPSETPQGENGYDRPGFHRLEMIYVGEIEFEFCGGNLRELSRRPEDAVRPWKDLKGNQ
jgi:hypothetical protein